MSDDWPEPPGEPGPFAGGPAVGPPPSVGGDGSTPARTPTETSPWATPPAQTPSSQTPPAPADGANHQAPAPPGPIAWGDPTATNAAVPPPPPAPGQAPPGHQPPGPAQWPGSGGPTPGGGPVYGGGPTYGGAPPFTAGPTYAGDPSYAYGAPGGVAPAPPGAPPRPGQPAADRAPLWLLGVAALVVLMLFAGAVLVVTSKSGPSYPDEWDPRVADIVEFVADERGLRFQHPVHVNFLTAAEYTEASRVDVGVEGPSAEEQEQSDSLISMLRALGLVEGTFDLQEANNQIADAGTLAYYDPSTEEVYVRGTELTPAIRVTVAHELVHVLQDQHFDLERMADLDAATASSLRAIAEGDATRVEEAFVASLDAEDRKAYQDETAADVEAAESSLADVPPILTAMFSAPYFFGPAIVTLAHADDGNEGVDALFDALPSEFAMFDPIANPPADHRAEDQVVIELTTPEGAEELDRGSFSPVLWYLVLASRVGEIPALEAVDGIEEDGFLSYRQDGEVCVIGAARLSDEAEAEELSGVFDDWAAAGPEGASTVEVTGDRLDLTSCDPGEDASAGGEVSDELLIAPVRRTYTYADLLSVGHQRGLGDEGSRCFADGVFDVFGLDAILDPAFMPTDEQQRQIETIATSC